MKPSDVTSYKLENPLIPQDPISSFATVLHCQDLSNLPGTK